MISRFLQCACRTWASIWFLTVGFAPRLLNGDPSGLNPCLDVYSQVACMKKGYVN
jgi:hypothetical protein